jgi:hypothetical protein
MELDMAIMDTDDYYWRRRVSFNTEDKNPIFLVRISRNFYSNPTFIHYLNVEGPYMP